jgi:photosystem II P680 reaction center D1 protein
LIRETTENESANEGYRFGQEEETYNIVAAHGYFGRLIFQIKVFSFPSLSLSSSAHFWVLLFLCSVSFKTQKKQYRVEIFLNKSEKRRNK